MAPEDDAISISSDSHDDAPARSRRDLLTPVIQNIVAALGGVEQVSATESAYVLGDSCHSCLKDLKRLWRKDDTDDERTVARILWDTRVLQNDLVPILLQTAGKGKADDKSALACADLVTAMTWPIDLAEELKELDDEVDAKTDYVTLIHAHRAYKAALLGKGVIAALFAIMLPPLAKGKGERQERDNQIINLVLHAFRNLAFIKDPPPNTHASGEQAEYANLQSKLVLTFQETHVLDALLTFASNCDNPLFNPWNSLLMEIFYLLFRGVDPRSLVLDQQQKTRDDLKNLLESEARSKREDRKTASSRHSRFGTTISVKSGGSTFVLHRQQAITAETSVIMDLSKKKVARRVKAQDELATTAYLSVDALMALQSTAKSFIINCFNRFLESLLKDIRAERAKISEKDNVRLLFVTKWFLEFFLAVREQNGPETWKFTLVSQIVEQEWIPWVLKRVREAGEEKPKQWTELQAGMDCLSQLLLLIEAMSASESFSETAEILQHKLYYNGEILDLAFECMRSYKEGSQSIAYLDSSVNLGYVLLRVLEKWARMKGKLIVRKKKKKAQKKKKAKGVTEEEGIVDVPSEEEIDDNEVEEDDAYRDSMTTFESFEEKFAHQDITRTCLVYLSRFREFDSTEKMKRVVGLLHRQAVRVKAEGLFFQVTTLELFHRLLKEEKTLPSEQPYKDLMQLIRFILRKFFKAVADDSFTLVEAFFPKSRGSWKKFSSYQPPAKAIDNSSDEEEDDDYSKEAESKHGPELYIEETYSWSEQLGIVMACLIDDGKLRFIDWIKETLIFVIGSRQRIVSDIDDFLSNDNAVNQMEDDDDDPDERLRKRVAQMKMPSKAAMDKFEDFFIPYDSEEKALAATKDQHLKLMFHLLKFFCSEEDADELQWYIPASLLPEQLQRSLDVIEQFLKEPLDLQGHKASELVSSKKRKIFRKRKTKGSKRRRRSRKNDLDGEDALDLDEVDRPSKERKKKEKKDYKSAQMIDDSDAELGDDEEFFRREKEQRERNEAAAALVEPGVWTKSSTMRAAGTKKRKKKAGEGPVKKFKTLLAENGGASPSTKAVAVGISDDEDEDEEMGIIPRVVMEVEEPSRPPRPKPRRKVKASASSAGPSSEVEVEEIGTTQENVASDHPGDREEAPPARKRPRPRPKGRPSVSNTVTESVRSAPTSPFSSPGRATSSALVSSSSPGSAAGGGEIEVDSDEDDDVVIRKGGTAPRMARKVLFISDDEDEE